LRTLKYIRTSGWGSAYSEPRHIHDELRIFAGETKQHPARPAIARRGGGYRVGCADLGGPGIGPAIVRGTATRESATNAHPSALRQKRRKTQNSYGESKSKRPSGNGCTQKLGVPVDETQIFWRVARLLIWENRLTKADAAAVRSLLGGFNVLSSPLVQPGQRFLFNPAGALAL
jgi:hypothetical protein